MPSWKNVLVYADGRPESSFAIAEGRRVAEHMGGKTTALDVLHYLPAHVPAGLLAMQEEELLGLMREQRREQLEEEIDGMRLPGLVEVHVTYGNPAFELVRHATKGKHDLIVKAARGKDIRHMTSFGSTALHLVRKSPTPVMLVSPHRALLEAPKVLCALALDDTDQQDFNRRLLASSRLLASVYGAELHVVHVIDRERTAAYKAFLSPAVFERFNQDRHKLLQDDMEKLISHELRDVPQVHAHLLDGDPSDHLTDMVKTHRFSHLVIGSVAHLDPGHLMGSHIEDVLSRVECSVLTLKPAGFKTPIVTDLAPAA